MPASSKRYQSQLFNFILRQSLRWTDRAAKTVRHLQVSTVWGIQALLYPVYAVIQATRNTLGKSATSDSRQFAPSDDPQTPLADAPIVTVLADIARGELDAIADPSLPEFPSPTVPSPNFPSFAQWVNSGIARIAAIVRVGQKSPSSIAVSPTPTLQKTRPSQRHIRGIASLIDRQKLVLVDDANQILDILNSQQHQHLEQRIFIEIGNYWIARQPSKIESSPQKKPNRLLGWMQNSPLAMSLNLFQEATQAALQKSSGDRSQTSPNFSTDVSSGGDRLLQPSSVPTEKPIGKSTVDLWNSTARSTQKSFTELHQFVAEKARSIRFPEPADPWQTSSQQVPNPSAPTATPKSPPFSSTETRPKALPKSLPIPDFSQHKVVEIVKSVNDSFQKQFARVTDRFVQIADPWLSAPESVETSDRAHPHQREEATHEPVKREPFQLGNRTFKQLPASLSLERPLESLKTWAHDSRNWLAEWGVPGIEPSPKVEVETSSVVHGAVRDPRVPDSIPVNESLSNPFIWESSTIEVANEPQSNWIDTKATSVEYIKHPLERILEWLDRVAFWLEKRMVQLWQSVQRFWQQTLHPNK